MENDLYVLKAKRNACLKSLCLPAALIAFCAAVFIFGALIVPFSIIGAVLAMFLAYFLPSVPLLTRLRRAKRVSDLFIVTIDVPQNDEIPEKREFVSLGESAADFFMQWLAYFLIIAFGLFVWLAVVIFRLILAAYFQLKIWAERASNAD